MIDDVFDKWNNRCAKLLSGLNDDEAVIMSHALEGQLKYNETLEDCWENGVKKRISIPLMRRLMANLLKLNIKAHYNHDIKLNYFDYNIKLNLASHYQMNIDLECDAIDQANEQLTNFITKDYIDGMEIHYLTIEEFNKDFAHVRVYYYV